MSETKRQKNALDSVQRVLGLAEESAGTARADDLIQIADRYLAIAKENNCTQ